MRAGHGRVPEKVRVNQHFFRSIVLAGYRTQYAICELPIPSLLVAGHTVPWAVDRSLRMNPRNGICLCTLHDRAFDKGLLAISSNYTLSVHPEITAIETLPAIEANFTRFVGRSIILPDRWHSDPGLLERHRSIVGL